MREMKATDSICRLFSSKDRQVYANNEQYVKICKCFKDKMTKCKKLWDFHVNTLQRNIENFQKMVYPLHYTKKRNW